MGDGSIPTIFFIVFLKPGEKNGLMIGSTALFKKNLTWRHGFADKGASSMGRLTTCTYRRVVA